MRIMKTNQDYLRTIAMLRYQANRYHSMGNGPMSQQLHTRINRLLVEKNAGVKN